MQAAKQTRKLELVGADRQTLRIDVYESGRIRLTIDSYDWGYRDIVLDGEPSAQLSAFFGRRLVEVP